MADQVICAQRVDANLVSQFTSVIDDNYYFQLLLGIPVRMIVLPLNLRQKQTTCQYGASLARHRSAACIF